MSHTLAVRISLEAGGSRSPSPQGSGRPLTDPAGREAGVGRERPAEQQHLRKEKSPESDSNRRALPYQKIGLHRVAACCTIMHTKHLLAERIAHSRIGQWQASERMLVFPRCSPVLNRSKAYASVPLR